MASTQEREARKEADKLFKEGKKCLSKGLLRWKPDPERAATYFEQAVAKYRLAGADAQEQLLQALLEAGAAFDESNALNSAARHLGSAVQLMVKMGQKREAAQLQAERVASLYLQNGQGRKASEELKKAAALVRDEDTEEALKLYIRACEVLEDEDLVPQGDDLYKTAVVFMIREERLDDAKSFLMRQAKGLLKNSSETHFNTVYKNFCGIIALDIVQRDVVAAKEHLSQFETDSPNFASSNEYQASSSLISAYESLDAAMLEEVKKDRTFKYIDTQIARLVRTIEIDEKAQQAVSRAVPAASIEGDGLEDDDDDLA